MATTRIKLAKWLFVFVAIVWGVYVLDAARIALGFGANDQNYLRFTLTVEARLDAAFCLVIATSTIFASLSYLAGVRGAKWLALFGVHFFTVVMLSNSIYQVVFADWPSSGSYFDFGLLVPISVLLFCWWHAQTEGVRIAADSPNERSASEAAKIKLRRFAFALASCLIALSAAWISVSIISDGYSSGSPAFDPERTRELSIAATYLLVSVSMIAASAMYLRGSRAAEVVIIFGIALLELAFVYRYIIEISSTNWQWRWSSNAVQPLAGALWLGYCCWFVYRSREKIRELPQG